MSERLTPRQLEILQHALGVDEHGQGRMYRDHFAAGPDDEPVCRELIALGYMRQVATTAVFQDFNCRVTDAGKEAVRRESPPPKKMTRSQDRYERFLRADLGCSFREFLRFCDKPMVERSTWGEV